MESLTDQHLSDETLSAWLDGQLSPAESVLADRHLGTCRSCAARYAGLRSLRDALRHLDPVPLPRDFRLPTAGRLTGLPLTGLPPTRPTHTRGPIPWIAARLVSAAVTFLGVILLAFGLLSSASQVNHFSAATNAGSADRSTSGQAVTTPCAAAPCNAPADHVPTSIGSPAVASTATRVTGTFGPVAVGAATATSTLPATVPAPTATDTPQAIGQNGTPTRSFGDTARDWFATPQGSALTGLGLTMLGLAGLVIFRRRS